MITVPPSFENFTALPTTLSNIWITRSWSHETRRVLSGLPSMSLSDFASAWGLTASNTSRISSPTPRACELTVSRPA